MTAQRILCPVDFSTGSNVAMEHAVELARLSGGKLFLLHVATPSPTYIDGILVALPPFELEPDPRLDEVVIKDSRVDVTRVHAVGPAAPTIIEQAVLLECDLIVLGTHGASGFTRFLLGSVSDWVLRHASCAVAVIKDKRRERTDVLPRSESATSTESSPSIRPVDRVAADSDLGS